MKKLVVILGLSLAVLAWSCGSEADGQDTLVLAVKDPGLNSTAVPKPKLHIVEQDEAKFLVDDTGELWYSLEAPYITIDVSRKVLVVNPYVYYAPGTTYYGRFYDGFNITCGCHPRAGCNPLKIDFGPEGGQLPIPASPLTVCQFDAFVIDGEGTLFETDSYLAYFE